MSDIEFTAEQILAVSSFGTLKRYIIQTTGLSYYEDKDRDLARAVARALGGKMFSSVRSYLAELAAPDSAALDLLVEELTIGETFFFRHSEMFAALREHVFPEIHSRKAEQKHLRIWSAGCSVGAEPYSLSILLRKDLAHRFHDWSVEIIGTDINRRFLRMAREAAYESWALRGMPEEMLKNCFDRQGKRWVLKGQFTEGVIFQQHNLVRDRFPSLGNNLFAFDLVICRNVMIYFTHDTVRQLAEQFHQSLIPGGWLVVGHAEPHTEIFRAFRTVNAPGAILYQRELAQGPSSGAVDLLQKLQLPAAPSAWKPPILPVGNPSSAAKIPKPVWPSPKPPKGEDNNGCLNVDTLRQLADAGDLPAARTCCEHLLQREKLNPEVHLLYGLILAQMERFDAAREALRRGIYLDRTLVLGHYHLAMVQRRLGELPQAVRSLRNAWALIDGLADDEPVRYGDGMTAGDLRSAIAMHMNHLPEQAPS